MGNNFFDILDKIIGIVSGIISILVFIKGIRRNRKVIPSPDNAETSVSNWDLKKTKINYYVLALLMLALSVLFLFKYYQNKCPNEKIELILNPVYQNDGFISGMVKADKVFNFNKYKVVVYYQYASNDLWIHPGKNIKADIMQDGEWKIEKIRTRSFPNTVHAYLITKHKKIPETFRNNASDQIKYCSSAMISYNIN